MMPQNEVEAELNSKQDTASPIRQSFQNDRLSTPISERNQGGGQESIYQSCNRPNTSIDRWQENMHGKKP